ncbi:FAD-dependent oxidoreductase [Massilia sp. CCM 8733]|uniref:FAD-dependent oxidoreductase n=1 Tax=Massilia mucilaginosa TaxID=2609282 RepID=A0ABX0NYF9_9BURK|nr:FAD-binding oxidoreductase [Massilia mucilaginosa]NHZ91799.1 FAD-dependent oxidoreductase [Massilia mucilaginosa]
MNHEEPKRIIIIGAGIVGASLAYHLARKGAQVTVVEAEGIASGVTGRSFAWLNTSSIGPDPIAQLRGAAISEYRRLETQLPGLKIQWTGALSYGLNAGESMHAETMRPGTVLVSRSRITQLEPNLRKPPVQAVYAPEQGALDAVAATHALIAGAREHGATILTQTPVVGLVVEGARVTGIETGSGRIEAGTVVLAAGTGIGRLSEKLHVSLPIASSPAVLIRYTSRPGLVRTIISSPEMEVRQGADGTLFAAEDFLDDAFENQPLAMALRTAGAIGNELDGVGEIKPEWACVGLRPIPADGIPIIGYLPAVAGLYVCAMHPGVTLAAIAGRLASEEIMDGARSAALGPCGPERFMSTPAT